MDMKNTNNIPNPSVTLVFSLIFLCGACHLFSSDRTRHTYLSFHSPPRLSFHEIPAVADRSNLLRLGSPVSSNVELEIIEDNSSTELSEFPLTSYDEGNEEIKVSNESGPNDLIPPSDPFVDFSLGSTGVDSTDQLIQIFENLERSGNTPQSTTVNFIPPYTTDSANFKIQSTSRYTRRVRP